MINVDAIKKLIDQMPQIKSQFTTESYPVASMYDYNARTRKTFNMDLQTIYKQPEFLQWKEQLLFELSKIENDDFIIETIRLLSKFSGLGDKSRFDKLEAKLYVLKETFGGIPRRL